MQEEAAEVMEVGQTNTVASAQEEVVVAAAAGSATGGDDDASQVVAAVAVSEMGDAPVQVTPEVDTRATPEQLAAAQEVTTAATAESQHAVTSTPDAADEAATAAGAEASAESPSAVVEKVDETRAEVVGETFADAVAEMPAEVVKPNEADAEVVAAATASTPVMSDEAAADLVVQSVEDDDVAPEVHAEAKEEQPTAGMQTTAGQHAAPASIPQPSVHRPPPPAAMTTATSASFGAAPSGGISPRLTPRARVAASLEQSHEMAQSDLTPLCESEVLVEFRRGYDNSHVNRMMTGSYSRYLLSTDRLHEAVLVESFYGSLPTVGTAPLHSLRDRADSETRSQQPFHDSRSASNRSQRHPSPAYTSQLTPRQSATLTGTMSSTMRREAELLNAETYRQLCVQREHRRHDPRHCQPQPKPRDFVYYNHKSKGYHVPYDPPDNALVLRYDDLYDFGDGTRFASRPPGPPRRNPTAPPPVTHGEWASRTVPPQMRTRDATPQRRVSQQQPQRAAAQRTREAMQQGCSSLRTAKALDPQKLHCSQFRKTRTIEDVVTERSAYPIHGAQGMSVVMHADRQSRASTPSRSVRNPAAVTTASGRGDTVPAAAMTFTDRTDKGVMGLLGGSIGYRTLA